MSAVPGLTYLKFGDDLVYPGRSTIVTSGAVTIDLTGTAENDGTIAINWTVHPGNHTVTGVYAGRDGVSASGGGAYESALLPMSTTTFQFTNLVIGDEYTLYVTPQVDGTRGNPTTVIVTAQQVAPDPGNATLFGFYAGQDVNGGTDNAPTAYARVSTYLGTPQVYRMFYSGAPPSNFVGSNADFGPPVVVSFKLTPASVISGSQDSLLNSFFGSIPTNRRVWWSYHHEPEDEIESGAYTAVDYRAAWEHIIALAPKRSTLRATLILMTYSLYKPSRNIPDYVPNGLDVLAWDSYLTVNTQTVNGVVNASKAWSDSYGLGYAIAETSVAGDRYTAATRDSVTTAFVQALVPKAQGANAEFVTWFETNKPDGDWRIRPSTNAVAAWNAAEGH